MSEKLTITAEELEQPTQERLVITEADLSPALDPTYNPILGLHKGEPHWTSPHDGNKYFNVPEVPHIFRPYVEWTGEDNHISRSPEPVTTLVAHGYRGSDGRWAFKDGRSVVDFIDDYNSSNPADPINVAAVCNPTTEEHPTTSHVVNSMALVSGYKEEGKSVVTIHVAQRETGYVYIPSSQSIPSEN
jgi:hypothetical protein